MNQTASQADASEDGNLIDEIIRMSDFNFVRLPMLDIIGERLADSMSVVLPELTGVMCEASLDILDYLPLSQIAEALPDPVVMAITEAQNLDGELMIALDQALVLTAMELILGGTANGDSQRGSVGFTGIELGFGRRLAELILQELQRGFAIVGDPELELDRIETDRDSVSITQPTSLCIRMRLTVILAGNSGHIEVIIPYDTLESVRPKLSKIHFGEPNEDGNPWKDSLQSQIERSSVQLETVLTEFSLPIQNVLDWKPGDIVNLWIDDDHPAVVYCAETAMYSATIGKRSNGNTAIRIAEMMDLEEEAKNGRSDH